MDAALLRAQLQLPRLADELFAEGVVRLSMDELKAGALVDAAGGVLRCESIIRRMVERAKWKQKQDRPVASRFLEGKTAAGLL